MARYRQATAPTSPAHFDIWEDTSSSTVVVKAWLTPLAAWSVMPEVYQVVGVNTVAGAVLPAGVIVMWSGTLASIPTGWVLCDGANGTPDLRDRFVVGAANLANPGTTGGVASVTPAGSVTAPVFTGTSAISTSAVTAGTPAGTVSTPTFTGNALATHQHELPLQNVSGTVQRFTAAATFGTGTSRAAVSTVTTTANTTSAAVALSQAIGAGTPAGTVSTPTFTGNALATHSHTLTPAGTNSTPTFSGNSQENRPPFYAVAFIMKT